MSQSLGRTSPAPTQSCAVYRATARVFTIHQDPAHPCSSTAWIRVLTNPNRLITHNTPSISRSSLCIRAYYTIRLLSSGSRTG